MRAAQGAEHAVEVVRRAGAALHGEPHRLVEHQHVVVFVKRDRSDEGAVLLRLRRVVARFRRIELQRRDAHRLPGLEPAFGCVRLPFTRTSPLRMMRWMWLNDRPGNRASKKRSTRMLFSSGVTATVCTPAENCAGLGATIARCGAGLTSTGCRSRGGHATGNARPLPRLRLRWRVLHAQIGLARIGSLLGSFFVSLIAIAAMTAAARAGLLPSAARLARAIFATSHEEPRSRRSFAQ